LTVKSGGTVEADQNGSWNGILLVYGDISNSGSITVKALENINTPGGLYHAIDATYSGTAVTGSYKRNLCRTLPVADYPIVSAIGATGGTGPNATPMEGDTLYGTVDGYGKTDAATPAGMFTFRWLLDDVPQGTGSSYTVPLSAVGKVCSVELYEIGSDYVFFGVDERVVTGYIKNNARVDLGTVSVKTSELLYLGGKTASDTNDGSTPEKALATANAAIARAADGGTIVVCGDTIVPAQQTRIEGKSLTFTNTDSTTTYPNPTLSMNRPYFDSDVTLQGVTWKQAGGSSYCSTGKNITLTLNAITPENISYIQGKAGSRLVVRDSTLTGIISGLLEFDSIELDRSAVTALFNSVLPNDASDFILKNGSTLSVSKDIKTLTSVGEGNTIQARKTITTDGKPAPAPVSVLCAVKIDSGKPIALTSYFKGTPKDGTPYLTGTDETFTLENFTLDSDRFALVKCENTLYAAARPVALAPTGIASDSATMCATATAIPATAAEFLWWKVGNEGNKATASISDTTSFSATLSGLLPGTAYAYQVRTQIGKTWLESAPVTFRTLIEQATPPTGSISGSVTNNTGVTCNITVTIEEGNTICATQVLSGVANTTASTFSFSALSDGFYNVVADNGAYKVTRLVEIKDGGAALNVALALGKTQSVVEILTPDTPPAAVNGLPEQFEETVTDEDKGYTAANELIVQSGGTVELKLAAERKEADTVADDVALITNAAAGQTIPLYLDLSVIKTVIPTSGSATETRLVSVPKLLTVVFPLPGEAVGKQNITVYRVHNGKAEALPGRDSGANGEWAEIRGNNAILHIRQFSTYAVGYTKPTPSGGGGVVSYPPVIRSGEHGTVSVSPKAPTSGNKVTITPKPDEGHAVGEVIVTDKNGKEIPIKDNGDGTFSYTQPSGKVTITVTFKPARPAWNPFVDVAEKDWFHDSVKYVYEHDLILGTSDTTFSPYWDTSRGMMITVLWRLEGSPQAPRRPLSPMWRRGNITSTP